MNIQEWHRSFKVQLDSLDKQSALRLQPEVVDIFLNKAINKIMIDIYDKYEETQEYSDALSSQTVIQSMPSTVPLLNITSTGYPNQWKVDLPPDYYHHLQSYAKLNIGGIVNPVRTVKQLLDNETKIVNSPFERADDTEVPIFFKDGGIYVYTPNKSILDNFTITYLKNPIQVSYKGNSSNSFQPISSDIDEYLHERIINLAAIYALENYSSERTPSKVQIKDVT
jgi:hypothetical protein